MATDQEAPLILVVDDDPIIRLDVGGTLSEAGYRTLEADSGEEALAKLAGRRPDLILTDIYMERGDGLSLIRRVRARDPHIPIVAMSGHDRRYEQLDRAEMIGANRALAKPIQRFELLAVIASLLPTASRGQSQPANGSAKSPNH
jgi:CheY-like chemotaxis protein